MGEGNEVALDGEEEGDTEGNFSCRHIGSSVQEWASFVILLDRWYIVR